MERSRTKTWARRSAPGLRGQETPGERARTVTWWAAGRVSHGRRPRRLRPAGPGGRIAATGRDPTGLSLRRRAETDFAPPAGDRSSQLSRPREILSQAISVSPETWFPPSFNSPRATCPGSAPRTIGGRCLRAHVCIRAHVCARSLTHK